MLDPWKKSYDQTRKHIKKQSRYFTNKGPSSQSYGFSSSHVWMWKLDYKESWVPKNWYFWTVVLEKTLESPLNCKEIQPVHPKGDQSWIFIGRTDAEAETPILWLPDAKNWFIGKDPEAGKDWRREEKGTTEGETVGWHHWRDGYKSEKAQGVGDGLGSLVCCSPWGHKELDTTICCFVFFWSDWTDWLMSLLCHLMISLISSVGRQRKNKKENQKEKEGARRAGREIRGTGQSENTQRSWFSWHSTWPGLPLWFSW